MKRSQTTRGPSGLHRKRTTADSKRRR